MAIQYALDQPFFLEDASIYTMNILLASIESPLPAHSHGSGCYEIHYIPAGYGTLQVHGRTYSLSPGTLYVTGPHVEHAQLPLYPDPMQEYCIYFRIVRSHKNPSPVLDAFCRRDFWLGGDDSGIYALLCRMFEELRESRMGYVLQVQLLLSQLILLLARSYEQPDALASPPAGRIPSNKNTLILEECFLYEYSTLTLPNLANRLNLSQRQTQRLLKDYYGQTFQQKKKRAQLSAAVTLLQEDTLSITEIADRLGFSSPEHFANTFKKIFGISPSTYRKQHGRFSFP